MRCKRSKIFYKLGAAPESVKTHELFSFITRTVCQILGQFLVIRLNVIRAKFLSINDLQRKV